MPSFDIASSVDVQILDNAVNIVKKEIYMKKHNIQKSLDLYKRAEKIIPGKTQLISKNKLTGFEIAGADDVFIPAKATLLNDKIRVRSQKIKSPKRVRYGWKNYFEASLFNQEGLPASSFQTD